MRDIFPRSMSLQENRCSHLISSFLAWSCSSFGHVSRPWKFNSSKIYSFWRPWADSPEAPMRTTGGTWLAGVTLPTTTLAGITMRWACRFLKQMGTQEDPGCNSPHVVVSTMEADSWESHAGLASMWAHMQCPQKSVLPCISMVPNRGKVTLCDMDMPLDIVQREISWVW